MLARFEVRERGLDEEHRTAEVDVERLLPRLGRETAERLGQRVRSIVHDDVDPTEPVDCPGHKGRAGVELAQVDRHRDRVATGAARGGELAQVCLGFGARVGLAASQHHLGAAAHQTLGDRPADTTGSTGDDRDASTHREEVFVTGLVHRVNLTHDEQAQRQASQGR